MLPPPKQFCGLCTPKYTTKQHVTPKIQMCCIYFTVCSYVIVFYFILYMYTKTKKNLVYWIILLLL